MNIGRLFLTVIVGFIYIFGSDFLIHAVWLGADYKATAPLWRPEEQMRVRFLAMLAAQLLCSIAFMYIWARTGWRRRSLGDGAVFGIWMGLFQQVTTIVLYVVTPMPLALAAKWFVSGLVQATLLGVLAALIYKPLSMGTDRRA